MPQREQILLFTETLKSRKYDHLKKLKHLEDETSSCLKSPARFVYPSSYGLH